MIFMHTHFTGSVELNGYVSMNEAEFSCRISKMDLCTFSSVELGNVKKKKKKNCPRRCSSVGQQRRSEINK